MKKGVSSGFSLFELKKLSEELIICIVPDKPFVVKTMGAILSGSLHKSG